MAASLKRRRVAVPRPAPEPDGEILSRVAASLSPAAKLAWDGCTQRRKKRLLAAALARLPGAALALESVWNPHNQAAVVRTCDGLGIPELALCGTDPFRPSPTVALGAERWVEIPDFPTVAELSADFRRRGFRLLASDLDPAARPLSGWDLTEPTVLLLGNEHEGVTPAARAAADGLFYLPMTGLVQSYNISVAAAMTGYELRRQREAAGRALASPEPDALARLDRWLSRLAPGECGNG